MNFPLSISVGGGVWSEPGSKRATARWIAEAVAVASDRGRINTRSSWSPHTPLA